MDRMFDTAINRVIEARVNYLLDEVSDSLVYIGFPANKNVLMGQAKWQIIKISKSGTVTTTAQSSNFETYGDEWDERAGTVTYWNPSNP
jgi:hypothetical protein